MITFKPRRNIYILKKLLKINMMKDKFLSMKIMIYSNNLKRNTKSKCNQKANHLKRLKNMNMFTIKKRNNLLLKKLYLKKSRDNNLMKGLRALI